MTRDTMTMLRTQLKEPYPWLLSLVPALLFTNLIFIAILQGKYPFFSLRRVLFAAFVLMVTWVMLATVIAVLPALRRAVGDRRLLVLAVVCAMGAGLITVAANRTGEPVYSTLLHPVNHIHIIALPEANPKANGDSVEIMLFDTQFGYTSYSQFQVDGEWIRTEVDSFRLDSPQRPASLEWRGRTGAYVLVEFRTGPDAGKVSVAINGGQTEVFDLYAAVEGKEALYFKFPPVMVEWVTSLLSQLFVSFSILFAIAATLLSFSLAIIQKNPSAYQRWITAIFRPVGGFAARNGYWLLYALPMIAVWGTGLMAFFPGLVSPDSVTHFQQAWHGGYDDWHSVLYTLLIAALTFIVRSPAVVAGAQILVFAVVVARGLKLMDELRAPFWCPWGVSLVMALSLPNILTVNTIWKDIPYTIAVFGLMLLMMRVVQLRGGWLSMKWNWLILGLVSLAVILFRQNGLFVPLISIGILFLLYPRRWKPLLASLALALSLFALFVGPVYRLLGVDNSARYKTNEILLHHLAAHHAAGTPLQTHEREFLYQVLPPSEWAKYNCATVNNLFFNPAFDRAYLKENTSEATQLLIRLFLVAPGVDLRHTLCASELVWRGNARTYLVESAYETASGRWVVDNALGILQRSQLPGVAALLGDWLGFIDQRENTLLYNLTWRPANLLLVALLGWGVLAVRMRDFRWFLTLSPLLAHSLTLVLINFGQEFRYQYPAYIFGLFGMGLLCVRGQSGERETPKTSAGDGMDQS